MGQQWFFVNNFLRELCVSAVKMMFMDEHKHKIMSTHEKSMCIREMPLPVRDPG